MIPLTAMVDPYHNMSISFDESLIFTNDSFEDAQAPQPVHSRPGTALPPPAYAPPLFPRGHGPPSTEAIQPPPPAYTLWHRSEARVTI
jgi:hypothetical protein